MINKFTTTFNRIRCQSVRVSVIWAGHLNIVKQFHVRPFVCFMDTITIRYYKYFFFIFLIQSQFIRLYVRPFTLWSSIHISYNVVLLSLLFANTCIHFVVRLNASLRLSGIVFQNLSHTSNLILNMVQHKLHFLIFFFLFVRC